MVNNKKFTISGFAEAVFVVDDIKKSQIFYCDVIGWQLITEIKVEKTLNNFWQLDKDIRYKSCLLKAPNSTFGALRLVQFIGIKQSYIRANSQIWDTGGIFDVNTRVTKIHKLANNLHKHQWFGVNTPVEMQFGPFKVYEWLAKSHDGITHALIERIEPALECDQKALFSEFINASMVIKDHDLEKQFFVDVLGFEVLIHQEGTFDKAASNVFGMPFELAASTPHVLTLLSADGTRDGTIELASFPELTGNNCTDNVKPFNLGITSLRFPIQSIAEFVNHLEVHKVDYYERSHLIINPYGKVNIVAVNTPHGNRLEFFESVGT